MQQIKTKIRNTLSDIYTDNEIRVLTKIILEEVLNTSYSNLLTEWNRILTPEEREQAETIIRRLQNHEPIQYILGKCEFSGLSFHVAPGVLIPRQETEELVSLIINDWKDRAPRILDIGTGSGCIAISLGYYLPESNVEAWDISEKALSIARKNASDIQVDVAFKHKDILQEPLSAKYDVIVSNPPYVLEKEKEEMMPNVLRYEPESALFVPDNNPLLFYSAIMHKAFAHLTPGGMLYFEINREFGEEICECLTQQGFRNSEIIKDICGNNRIVKAER